MVLVNELSDCLEINIDARPTLEDIYKSGGMNRSRFMKLYSILYEHGPGNGTFLTLPFDQLVEHGPGHQFKWSRSAESESVIELANRGEFSALALSIGQAEKYQHDIGNVPLIVKIDGHLLIGDELEKYHPRPMKMSSVERAAKVADAIGIAWYPGEIESGQDLERVAETIEEAHNYNLPVVLWGYSRGPAFNKIQADSLFCCHYSVSLAESLGADVVKVKFPAFVKPENIKQYKSYLDSYIKGKMPEAPEAYLSLENNESMSKEEIKKLHIKRSALIASVAGRTLIGYSGGPRAKDPLKELLESTEVSLGGGIEGRIVGRNLWGTEIEKALDMNRQIVEFMRNSSYDRVLDEDESRFTKKYD